ncbi:Peptidase propeptide and YPEB domain-containing protein [Mariprofundus ferrinatatus]|uniref:Peptidase propeptide and YPEB domain-containing protein n=1 Tax=Mariprofundus ferrinatatus TaxID=1921087 RepID=A0A2K8L4D3_9PROT|nr:PepSY domain-containing protein [Mariprofundus ferrinatatus]ATX82185.1 Peptidase propeptide and YPEB domain-containing protein [Mariprofundus ferrinatatus]
MRLLLILLMLSLPLLSPAAWGDEKDHERAHRLMHEHQVLPLSRIVEMISGPYPGKILDVELEEEDNEAIVYEMKILGKDRGVRKIKVDARTGNILESEIDD